MNLFSFIKSRVSITTVISEYTTLKKAGLYLKGLCPFHQEKTPSFTVSPHREIFYCFGCHSGGDAIAFIEKAEQCTPLEAATYLAERYQIEIPDALKQSQEKQQSFDARERYWKLCAAFGAWCHDQLLKSPAALEYLKDRGINAKTVEHFKLGLFPATAASQKKLLGYMSEQNFLLHDLLENHLLIDGKNIIYSPFTDRIIFPIKSHLGNFCGFGGRIYKPTDERPKYYNSKENPYFSKGHLLFGLDLAKKAIQQTGCALLVEGYMDCLAMVQHGYSNTVATLGTACTIEQLHQLARYAQELIVVYDGDQAGQNAMLRLTELCWQVNLELKIIQLPSGTDPANLLQRPDTNFQALFGSAKDIFLFFVEQTGKNFQGKKIGTKLETIRTLIGIMQKLDDPLKQDLLLHRAAQTFDIPTSALTNEFARLAPAHRPAEAQKIPSESTIDSTLKEITTLEKKLFSVIINNVKLLNAEDTEYLLEYLSLPLQDLLRRMIPCLDFMHFFDTLTVQEKQMVSQLIAQTYDYQNAEQLEYLLTQFQRSNWKSFVTSTKIKLIRAQQAGNKEDEEKVLHQFQELKKKLISKGLI